MDREGRPDGGELANDETVGGEPAGGELSGG